MPRERVPVLARELVARFAVPVPLLLAARVPVLFALVEPLLLRALPLLDAVDREALLLARVFLAAPERDCEVVELRALVLRAPPLRAAPPLLLLLLDPPSSDHLPDITRCAASATASAISDPSRVALVITEFAALLALSAASIPASRIFLRADGLALIAAAAAARPAASISLLIAALVILSTVLSFEPFERDEDFDDEVFDDVLRLLDFAIANLPVCPFVRHMKPTTVPLRTRKGGGFEPIRGRVPMGCRYVKGDRRSATIPSNMVSGRR